MLDRRKCARGRVYYGGRIVFNDRRSTMDCIVRNYSDRGAKVDFASTHLITDEVDLTIDRKGLAYRARMIWRRGDVAGFVFRNSSNVPVATTLDVSMRLRATERAMRQLRRHVEQMCSGY